MESQHSWRARSRGWRTRRRTFRTLGRYFTFTVQASGDQAVNTKGPYRAIRHPSHTGLLLATMEDLGADYRSYAATHKRLVPFVWWESASGARLHFDLTTALAIAYVVLLPGVAAYFCWNRGVELVGANRAGQFVHLMPVFGSALAILVLGEAFRGFHAAGALLIFAGIVLATREPGRRPA